MQDVCEKRKKFLKKLIRANPFDISEFISKVKSKEWLEIALDENIFDFSIWKKCENIDGFKEMNYLIVKFGKEIEYNDKLKSILESYLNFESRIYFLIVSECIGMYLEYNLLKELISGINRELIKCDEENHFYINRLYLSLLENLKMDDQNKYLISSVYGNSIILGTPLNSLQYNNIQYDLLVDTVVEVFSEKLDLLRKIDCSFKSDFTNKDYKLALDNEDYFLDEHNYLQLKINDLKYNNDYLYSDVEQWINSLSVNSAYMRRNFFSKLLSKYFKRNLNKKIIYKLIDNESIYYKKIGFHYLNIYFNHDVQIEVLSKISDYEILLRNETVSNVLSTIIKKNYSRLNDETKIKVKKAFNSLKNEDFDKSTYLIRAYNLLKEDFSIIDIDLPERYKYMKPIEVIGKPQVGCVNEVSFLDDNYIIEHFEESLNFLNENYRVSERIESKQFVKKSYRKTVNRMLEISSRNNILIKYDLLVNLHPGVLADLVDIIDVNDSLDKIIELYFDKLLNLNEEEANDINKSLQTELSRAINKIVEKCKDTGNIKWEVMYNKINEFKDLFEPIVLDNYNCSVGKHKYQDLFISYINTSTYELFEVLFMLAGDEEDKIQLIYQMIVSHLDYSLYIATLGNNYNKFIYNNVRIDLKKILSSRVQKEIFFCLYVLNGNINDVAATNILYLCEYFIFDADLVCKDKNVFELLGQMIYLIFENTDEYARIMNRIINEYFENKNDKIKIIVENIVWKSLQSEEKSKQLELLDMIYQKLLLNEDETETIRYCFELLKKVDFDTEKCGIATQLINMLNSTSIDYEVYTFYKFLKELQVMDELSECKEELCNCIFNKLRQLNSSYCWNIKFLDEKK